MFNYYTAYYDTTILYNILYTILVLVLAQGREDWRLEVVAEMEAVANARWFILRDDERIANKIRAEARKLALTIPVVDPPTEVMIPIAMALIIPSATVITENNSIPIVRRSLRLAGNPVEIIPSDRLPM